MAHRQPACLQRGGSRVLFPHFFTSVAPRRPVSGRTLLYNYDAWIGGFQEKSSINPVGCDFGGALRGTAVVSSSDDGKPSRPDRKADAVF